MLMKDFPLRSPNIPGNIPVAHADANSEASPTSDGAETAGATAPPQLTDLTDHPLYAAAGDLVRHPLWVGLVSVPVLISIAGGRQLAHSLDQLGTWGEEIFRGDRLPLLQNTLESKDS